MLLMAGGLAAVTALVATVIYANVDANRTITPPTTPTTAVDPSAATPTTIEPSPTTSRVPEILSPDELAAKVAPTIRLLRTLDPQGQPVQGTAFVVGSVGGQTMLATSFDLVRASTRTPSPDILLGDKNQKATLWTWQENRDLALLVVGGSIESLPWATEPVKAGDKIFAAGAGQKVSPGVVSGVGDVAIEHNIFIDDVRVGAPLVNQKGEIVAIASKVYNPSGKGTDTLFIAIPIRQVCERLLRCGGGNTTPASTTPGDATPTPTTTSTPTTSTAARR